MQPIYRYRKFEIDPHGVAEIMMNAYLLSLDGIAEIS
jgi:hypothetical protein